VRGAGREKKEEGGKGRHTHRDSTVPAEHLLLLPPPNMAAANFVVITNGEGCALNGTAVAAVLIDQ